VVSGTCTWRVTCRTRSWTDLCGRVEEAVCQRYSRENGFRIRVEPDPAKNAALLPKDVRYMEVYRGLTSGFTVGCWFTGQDPSGGADVVRLGVGRSSRLEDWTDILTFFSACLPFAVVVRCLDPFSLVHVLASPPIVLAIVGTLVLFLMGVSLFLSWHVFRVAARLFLDPLVAAAGYLEGNRLSDREIEDVVELVRGVVENSPAVVDVRDGWGPCRTGGTAERVRSDGAPSVNGEVV
jgi:hypothetical protein